MSEHPAQTPQSAVHHAAYVYTLADYQASRRAKRALSPVERALWRWRYAWIMVIPFAALVYTGWGRLSIGDALSWDFLSRIVPIFLALLLFVALIDVLFDKVLAPWVFRRLAIANKPLALAFNDDGIVWSSKGMRGEFAWTNVMRLIIFKDYLFLFISKMEALCIPKRAFASGHAFESLVDYAKERVNGQAL